MDQSTEHEYLELLVLLNEQPGTYHWELKRQELHQQLCEKHNLEYYLSKEIMGRLDAAIGFKLPLKPYQRILPFARELERLLAQESCRQFCKGEIVQFTTRYGRIRKPA